MRAAGVISARVASGLRARAALTSEARAGGSSLAGTDISHPGNTEVTMLLQAKVSIA